MSQISSCLNTVGIWKAYQDIRIPTQETLEHVQRTNNSNNGYSYLISIYLAKSNCETGDMDSGNSVFTLWTPFTNPSNIARNNNIGILCVTISEHPLQLPKHNERDWFETDSLSILCKFLSRVRGFLSPRYGASSGCGWWNRF